ncbi:hypothetical protein B4U79_17730 [Dinothrombium tinctorium]|uniref:Uncharacterized protein n=1 Tax=Dinothrombium tinctorium TaxID=1965070 RepID=A0A3S3SPP8_9ACAR|nr:hypothetical protein B4U79_17730 [Dinothrombium tinctorium]
MQTYRKLRQAFELFVFNRLKENSDDTLLEKLVSLLADSELFAKWQIDESEWLSLLSFLESSLRSTLSATHSSPHSSTLAVRDDIDVSASLRIMGALLRHEHVYGEQTDVVKSCLQIIANFLPRIATTECCDYSLQAAYLNCIHNLSHRKNCKRFLLAKHHQHSFPLLLFTLINSSQSHFVRNAAEKLLLSIVSEANEYKVNEIESLFNHVLTDLISNLPFLKSLLSSANVSNHLCYEYNLSDQLLQKFDDAMKADRIAYLYCRCLGCVISERKKAEIVFNKLLARNELKGLQHFCCELVKRNKDYVKHWLLYCIYPLFANCKLNAVLSTELNCSAEEKELVASLSCREVLKCSLSQMSNAYFPFLCEKQLDFVVKAIGLFLCENVDKKEMKKLVSEAISILSQSPHVASQTTGMHSMSQEFKRTQVEQRLEILSIVIRQAKQSQKCEILKAIRILIQHCGETLSECTVIKSICSLIHDILRQENIVSCIDECDSALEVLFNLSLLDKNLFVSTYPDLVESFWNVWTLCSSNPGYSSLTALCLPIVFDLDFVLSKAQLKNLQLSKHDDIIFILTNYLHSEDYNEQKAAIDTLTLKGNMPRLLYLCTNSTQRFFASIGQSLFNIASFNVDFELQLNVLKFLSLFVAEAIKSCREDDFENLVVNLYENGFFDALYHTLSSNCSTHNVKSEAFRLKMLVLNDLILRIGKLRFEEVIKNCSKPNVVVAQTVMSDLKCTKSKRNREEVLDEMFADNGVPFTHTLLEELLHCRHKDSDCNESVVENRSNWQYVEIVNLLSFLYDSSDISHESPVLCILDDILSSQAIRNETSIDCY